MGCPNHEVPLMTIDKHSLPYVEESQTPPSWHHESSYLIGVLGELEFEFEFEFEFDIF